MYQNYIDGQWVVRGCGRVFSTGPAMLTQTHCHGLAGHNQRGVMRLHLVHLKHFDMANMI